MDVFKNGILASFAPYGKEIRRLIIRGALFFGLLFLGGFFCSGEVVKLLVKIAPLENVQIIAASPFQFIDVAISVGIWLAVVGTFPFFLLSLMLFLWPALTKREKFSLLKFLPLSLLLFALGFTFGCLIMYYVLIIVAQINLEIGLVNMWDIRLFFSQVLITAAILGVIFQFPILLTLLIKFRIFSVRGLRKNRHWAIILAFAIPALLPPTDGLSLLIMALPLIFLFEATIFFNRRSV